VGQAPVALRDAGDPEGEVGAAYPANEPLRGTYLAGNVLEAHRRLVACYDYCHASDVPELERLARTIGRWETPILRWHHSRLTNATTEGTNLIVQNIKRLGFGFRNFENYRLRLLLALRCPMATSTRRINTTPSTTHQRVERVKGHFGNRLSDDELNRWRPPHSPCHRRLCCRTLRHHR
jgi:hypothetical protein